ncbi:MAG: hypothetical protein EXQ93_00170 [Alphaproteobacteria bacterium]|nr:hypothetical protein [Alphaproteobacteria bacterium]
MDRRWIAGGAAAVAAVAAYFYWQANAPPGAEIDTQALAALLSDTAREVRSRAPIMVDAERRLMGADAADGRLVYHYVLVTVNKADVDSRKFIALKKSEIVSAECGRAEVRYLLNQGATLAYIYDDKLGERIANIGLARNDCPAQ